MSSPSPDAPVILLFRRDLRLADNPAVAAAAASGRPVIPLYVLDESEGVRPLGGAGRWWLDKSLRALAAALQAKGSRLVLARGDLADAVADVVRRAEAAEVVLCSIPEPAAAMAEAGMRRRLEQKGVKVRAFNASLLHTPGQILNGEGRGYQVFTAYWRTARPRLELGSAHPEPRQLRAPTPWPGSESLDGWDLHPASPDWSHGFDIWTPGEAGAQARLDAFVGERLADYADQRDLLDREGGSRLSPHLHWGEIGPAQLVRAVQGAVHAGEAGHAAGEKLLAELGWRDFAADLLAQHPQMPSGNLRPEFDRMAWRHAPDQLKAWQEGRTGFAVVDAAMRQLWRTGFMPNRARMIAASFLTKDLLIDWRQGEAWFWDCLVDADLASNTMNWQWAAGSGVDAQPFFRIFNPASQAGKFDPDGGYVRRWASGQGGEPIVDHTTARQRALEAYRAARTSA